MEKTHKKVLVVDDEPFNLDILTDALTSDGWDVIQAIHGKDGLEKLQKNSDIDIIVLDRMMPVMNGIDMLKELKTDPKYTSTPVIMQTAATSSEQIQEGIQEGVYYYLPKPFDIDFLISVVKAAYEQRSSQNELNNNLLQSFSPYCIMKNASFTYKTVKEAKELSLFLARCFPDPERVIFGIHELLLNAVEHGNLDISYEEKSKLMIQGTWLNEIEKRSQDKLYTNRIVHVNYEVNEKEILLRIEDEGKGFDYTQYLSFDVTRATHLHGRGIATSKMMSFDRLEYKGKGNIVECFVKINTKSNDI